MSELFLDIWFQMSLVGLATLLLKKNSPLIVLAVSSQHNHSLLLLHNILFRQIEQLLYFHSFNILGYEWVKANHSFHSYLLCTSCVPGTVLNKTNQVLYYTRLNRYAIKTDIKTVIK